MRKVSDFLLSLEPRCSFWSNSLEDWSQEGCEAVENSSDYTVCRCNHLTNFGVIMDINGNLEDQVSQFYNKSSAFF
jgi:hypothetical protein